MDTSTYKRYAQGLLSVPEEKRIEEVEKLLYMLGHNWEDKKLLYMGSWRGNEVYINGTEEDVEEFEKFMKRAHNDRVLIANLKS